MTQPPTHGTRLPRPRSSRRLTEHGSRRDAHRTHQQHCLTLPRCRPTPTPRSTTNTKQHPQQPTYRTRCTQPSLLQYWPNSAPHSRPQPNPKHRRSRLDPTPGLAKPLLQTRTPDDTSIPTDDAQPSHRQRRNDRNEQPSSHSAPPELPRQCRTAGRSNKQQCRTPHHDRRRSSHGRTPQRRARQPACAKQSHETRLQTTQQAGQLPNMPAAPRTARPWLGHLVCPTGSPLN